MKCYSNKCISIFILILFSTLILKTLAIIHTDDSLIVSFNKAESKSYAQFAKMAIYAKKPLIENCKECITPSSEGYKIFFFYEFKKSKSISYKFFIHYNDLLKKIVISFGATSIKKINYLQNIYNNFITEIELKNFYNKRIKNVLLEKISKISKSGRKFYNFVFTGYSLGASLAVLSYIDSSKSGLIGKSIYNPTVYTYTRLKSGIMKSMHLII